MRSSPKSSIFCRIRLRASVHTLLLREFPKEFADFHAFVSQFQNAFGSGRRVCQDRTNPQIGLVFHDTLFAVRIVAESTAKLPITTSSFANLFRFRKN